MASFKDKVVGKNNNVLIVDAMNLAFRWKHQGKSEFLDDYIKTVQSLALSYSCANIIIAADQGSSYWRKSFYPEYKANRAEKYKDQTEEEKEAIEAFFSEYEKTLEVLQEKFLVLRYRGVEADDIAAYVVSKREEMYIEDVWLISSDRDWDLLVNENVSRFSTVTRKETTVFNWEEYFDFPIEDYISFKALTGDSGDNVAGITGVGPKRATDLIKQYGTAFDVYDAIPINTKYKYIQSINESEDLILTNYKLMDLLSFCEDAIEFPGHSLVEIDNKVKEFMNVN